MKLSQSQINTLIFGWYLILRVFIFVIISLYKKKNLIKNKVVKFNEVHDSGYKFKGLSHEIQANLISCDFNIKKNISDGNF